MLGALKPFLVRLTAEIPQVKRCGTFYHNAGRPSRPGFRLGSKGIEGIWSDGKETVKFRVDTSATTTGQELAVLALLNEWLQAH
jgi:hypothetical protein